MFSFEKTYCHVPSLFLPFMLQGQNYDALFPLYLRETPQIPIIVIWQSYG